MATWQDYLSENQTRYLDELVEFLEIPSISSLSEHLPDVQLAAEWVSTRMKKAGIEQVSILPTGGHPVVYGQWLNMPDKPTVLIYGHFDTQPVDPVDLWDKPPFEPDVQADRVVARGASDDKGNMLTPILAVEALLNTEGSLPVNVKFLFEGQEEIGSPQLPQFIDTYKDLLDCDLVFSADGGQFAEDQPSLLIGLRGLCALQIDVKGANTDLHSGQYGGTVQNPIHALVRLLDSMRSETGEVKVPGFYDKVRPLTDEDKRQMQLVPFNEFEYKHELGIVELFGEKDFSPLERTWARPTLEINGIYGGFQGEGVKTVLPSEAHAKITCRLVADQDPQEIIDLIRRHVEAHTLPGVSITLTPEESAAAAYLMPSSHPANAVTSEVLMALYNKEPLYIRSGGSIPFCTLMLEKLGVYTVVFAFGLDDEKAHAPNEFFRRSSFELGQKGYCMLLQKFAELKPDDLKI